MSSDGEDRKVEKRKKNNDESHRATKHARPSERARDLISQLPNDILHSIIAFNLPRKDAARTCMISKTWKDINYSNPFLSFDERDFFPLRKQSIIVGDDRIFSGDFNYGLNKRLCIYHLRRQNQTNLEEEAARKERHNSFMNYVENRMAEKLQHESSPIQHFHLTIVNFNHEHDSPRLDLWLNHAVEKRVCNLILTVFTSLFGEQKEIVYRIPSSLFVSQTLSLLVLNNCKLNDVGGNIKLPHLTRILLCNLDVEDGFIRCLTFGSPLLKVLLLTFCLKLTTLQVTNLLHLERVAIRSCPDLKCVDIQSPQLDYFQFFGCEGKSCQLNLLPSKVIKHLLLAKTRITSAWLQNLIVKCENLVLIKVHGFEDTKLSSQMLCCLVIYHCIEITKVIEIDCPNLYSLKYYGNPFPIHSVHTSELRKFIFEFSLDDYQQNTPLSDHLKKYFGETIPVKEFIQQSIIYWERHEGVIILDGLVNESTIDMLGDVKALMLKTKITVSSLNVGDLVDHFFGNSRILHKILYIVSAHEKNSDFPQALYDRLSSNTKENSDCCEDGVNQCWRHRLFKVMKDSNNNNVPTLLRSYQSKDYQISRILLEWKI